MQLEYVRREVMFGPEMNPLTKIHQPVSDPIRSRRGNSLQRETVKRRSPYNHPHTNALVPP